MISCFAMGESWKHARSPLAATFHGRHIRDLRTSFEHLKTCEGISRRTLAGHPSHRRMTKGEFLLIELPGRNLRWLRSIQEQHLTRAIYPLS